MGIEDKYTTETITGVRPWTESLFSFRTTRDRGYRFVPGQFARLGVKDNDHDAIVWRAYSIASAAHDEHLEFFSVVVPGGAFTSRLSKLKEGDEIFVERRSYGFLTTDRFEAGKDLYGTPFQTFLNVTWPATIQGVIAGAVLVGLPAVGDFATAQILGGPNTYMIGNLINDQFTNGGYPPFGAALTIVLMILLSLLMVFYLRSASAPSEATI